MTAPIELGSGVNRSRLLAFAFARADLLLELDRGATITFASGAARWAVGRSADELVGQRFPALASPESRGVLRELQDAFKNGQRLKPQTILFQCRSETVAASIAGCPMPDTPNRYFLTIAHPSTETTARPDPKVTRNEVTGLLDQKSFEAAAKERLDAARARGEQLDMTMVDLGELAAFRERLPNGKAETFMRGVGLILKQQSAGGDAAAQISDTKFSILHGPDVVAKDIESEISTLAKRIDPETRGVSVLARSLELDAGMLEGEDAGRALVYAMNKFAQAQAGEFSISKLSDGLKALISETVTQVATFRETLAGQGFTLAFQPIVDLLSGEVQHQEALTRLPDGSSPFQMVTFVEEVGLVTELDHAVCRQALELLSNNASIVDIAINISGRSLQSEVFVAALFALLKTYPIVRPRVKIEITESSRIERLDVVRNVVLQLQKEKHKICLDDFGAGSATLNYLRMLPVDILKIDGVFVKDLAKSKLDMAMVRSIGSICRELDMQSIAEFVEDERQLSRLIECRIQKGQGYLFGKPRPVPYGRRTPVSSRAATSFKAGHRSKNLFE